MASAAADPGLANGLVAMTSPSSIAGWFDTVPTTVPSSMTSHSSKVGIVADLRLEEAKEFIPFISPARETNDAAGINALASLQEKARNSSMPKSAVLSDMTILFFDTVLFFGASS
jgi:hypothetical protein